MPLKILLTTIGSSGDVHPFIGIGRALKARGHSVTLVTNEIFAEQVRANGLGFIALGTTQEAERLMGDPDLWNLNRGFKAIMRGAVLPNIRRLHAVIREQRTPSTVVVASTLCLGARVAQDDLGVPTATVHLQPLVFRSKGDGPNYGQLDFGPGMPRIVRKLLYSIIDTFLVDPVIAPEVNAFRGELGLPPVKGIFSDYVHSPELNLGLFPDWFCPQRPDWPQATHLTGFVLHDESQLGLAPEVSAFLGAGDPPLLVTPGSAAQDRDRFFRNTVEACRALGVRAMLVTNFPKQLPPDLPPGVRAFSYLPFSRVLPHCSGIIYHGGVGTLAQATRAGVPQLVVPNAHDQPDNGSRIERIGLGFMASQRAYRTPRGATRAIGRLLGESGLAERCRQFAPRVDGAASLERACSLIEELGKPGRA